MAAGTVLIAACHCSAADAPRSLPTIPQMLAFEAAHTGEYSGRVGEKIRAQFGIPPARYFQLLGRAIATEEALRHDPVTTNRLRRLAEHQERTRASRM